MLEQESLINILKLDLKTLLEQIIKYLIAQEEDSLQVHLNQRMRLKKLLIFS